MPKLYDFARLGLFALDPEQAHEVTLRTLEAGVYPRAAADDPRLSQTVCGIHFPNPIGMAAGFDKDARVAAALLGMGFGFTEAGTVTPQPQPGNARPRVFRLVEQGALINRLGFNGGGHQAMLQRLSAERPRGVLGINIGANKTSADPAGDYVTGLRAFSRFASYIAVNISSPNTPGLRDLQAPERLDALLSRIMTARAELDGARPPLFVKLAPDIADDDLPAIVERIEARGVDGMILTNTTLARDGVPANAHRGESGGLSGRPLFARATRTLARVYELTGGRLPLIGGGGVDSGEAALAKIRAGASLVQLYTGLIYEGPGLIADMKWALLTAMARDGADNLAALRGRDSERWANVTV